jgi:hypothetical protein
MNNLSKLFVEFLDLINVKSIEMMAMKVFLAAAVFLTAFWVWRILQRTIDRRMRHNNQNDEKVIRTYKSVARSIVLVPGILLAVHVLGINLSSLFTTGGLFAVALAFAMKNISENYVSGMMLRLERTIKPGDVLETEGAMVRVKSIGFRATIVRTKDERDLVIPNSQLSDKAIVNWGRRRKRRVIMMIGLTYDTPREKLDKFVESGKLFRHFMNAMDHQGIIGLDITGYGNYGWATTSPVRSVADAQKLKFRTAEAAVNQLVYKEWGINPVAMPWPDVPVALKQGVIDGLDHTPMVCNITKKFEVAKYYTYVNYAQGLFIWIFNKAWFNSLPADLQKTFKEVVREVCADIRVQTKQQEIDQIEKAKAAGIEFITLPDEDMAFLTEKGNAAHVKYAPEINKLYDGDTYRPKNFLKEVQDYIGYKP